MRMSEWMGVILRFNVAREELARGVTPERMDAFQRLAMLLLVYHHNGATCAESEALLQQPEWAKQYGIMEEKLRDMEGSDSHSAGGGEAAAGGGFSARYREAFGRTKTPTSKEPQA